MRRFRKEFGLKKARILRERLIPVSQRLKIGINRHPLGVSIIFQMYHAKPSNHIGILFDGNIYLLFAPHRIITCY